MEEGTGTPVVLVHGLLGTILGSPFGVAILKWISSVPPLSEWMTRENLALAFAREEAIPEGWTEYTRALLSLPGTLEAFVHEAQRGDPSTLRPEELDVPALVVHGEEDFAP